MALARGLCDVSITSQLFGCFRYLKSTRAHLLMQLCAVLIVFYIIFLAGIERTSDVVSSWSLLNPQNCYFFPRRI